MVKGIVRKTDDLGRVVIPKEMRNTAKIGTNDSVDIYFKDGVICVEPYKENSGEKQYKVEKYINGDWLYEGTGPIKYVNKIMKTYAPTGTVIRIKEAAED